jgi:hypothetical protein
VELNKDSALPARPSIHSIFVTEQVGDYCAATVSAEFRDVEEGFEVTLLSRLLEGLPTLIPFAHQGDFIERLKHLGRGFRIQDWRVAAQSEMRLTGRTEILRFLKTVPLLSEDQVRARLRADQGFDFKDFLQIRFADATWYYEDQFASDGTVHMECVKVLQILKKRPSAMSDWDIAMWWMSSTGWLDGFSPRDIYKENPTALFDAAEQEMAEDGG